MDRHNQTFTLAARVVAVGQHFRSNETPSKASITVRFLAEREVARQRERDRRFSRGGVR